MNLRAASLNGYMKVVFMGTPEFACKPLVCLNESPHDVVAVVTGPDERSPRGGKMRPTPVKQQALSCGLNVITPSKLAGRKLRDNLSQFDPDIFVVIAFKILPRKLYTLPRLGSINIHASLLPRYRGAAPINWALINGDKETGLSSFLLNDKVDTGDIVLQQKFSIDDNENFDALYARLSDQAGPFALRSLDRLADNNFVPIRQDNTEATPAPKITPENAMIDFGFPAGHVRNFIRGLSSVPGAYTWFRDCKVKFLDSDIYDGDTNPGARPGTIIPHRKKLLVQCADSALEVRQLLPQGKKAMDGGSFINGFRPNDGECFGEVPGKA